MKLDDGLCSEPDHDIAAVDALWGYQVIELPL